MCDPYRVTRGVDPVFDEIDDAGCLVTISQGIGGGGPGDLPPVLYACDITRDGSRITGTGGTKEEAFQDAARLWRESQ